MNISEEIAQYEGLTEPKLLALAAQVHKTRLLRGPALTSPSNTIEYLQSALRTREREVFTVVFLDTKHRVINIDEMFTGTLDTAHVYPREIAKKALSLNAGAIICAHNHPSGVSDPSMADKAITSRIKDALMLFEIRLLDHFVIGDGEPVSMASRGML